MSEGLRQQVGQLLSFAGRLAWSNLPTSQPVSRRGTRGRCSPRGVGRLPARRSWRTAWKRSAVGWTNGVTRRLDLHAADLPGHRRGRGRSSRRVPLPRPRITRASRERPGSWPVATGRCVPSICSLDLPARRERRRPRNSLSRPSSPRRFRALHALGRLGIEAEVAVGHSLGELTAPALGRGPRCRTLLLRIAAARGRVMATRRGAAGVMASLAAGPSWSTRC